MNTIDVHLDNATEFFIMTPMIKSLHDTIKQWTWCGLTGGVIVGEARCGKSIGVRSLKESIQSRAGEDIPIFRISIGNRDVKTIRSVYLRIANKLGFKIKKSSTSDEMAFLINMHLVEAAISNSSHQVILIIDEAQYMTVDQLSVFAEIYNDLIDAHCNCTVFFVANESQFEPLAKELIKNENTYLRERFFNHIHAFYGIRNQKELKSCLKRYDAYVLHHASHKTATEYYCPKLYESGWRLSDVAATMWSIYHETCMKPLKHQSWNMSQFTRTTNILLMDYLEKYEIELNDEILEGLIMRSIEASGIHPNIHAFVGRHV